MRGGGEDGGEREGKEKWYISQHCYLLRLTAMTVVTDTSMGCWWNNADRQKLKFSKTDTSPTVSLSTTHPNWSETGTNPCSCSDKLTTQYLVPCHDPVLCSHLNITVTDIPANKLNTFNTLATGYGDFRTSVASGRHRATEISVFTYEWMEEGVGFVVC
jgi:hypothetical protein